MPDPESNVSESAVRVARDLWVVVGRLRRRLKATYDSDGLTPSQTSVLSRLDKKGPATASALATAEGIRPQSIATTLATLEERGLVERRPDPGDGRRQLVSVSTTGREYLGDRRHAAVEWLARALHERFTEDERGRLVEALVLLERIAD